MYYMAHISYTLIVTLYLILVYYEEPKSIDYICFRK